MARELARAGSITDQAKILAWLVNIFQRAEPLMRQAERAIELRVFRPALCVNDELISLNKFIS